MSSNEGFGGQRTKPPEDTPTQHRSVRSGSSRQSATAAPKIVLSP
jgi:hypothetical protein